MEYHKKRYGNNSKNMRKIKIAFIGAGNMTTEHIKCFYDEKNVELTGIFSRTRIRSESLSKLFNIKYVCDSVEELYNKTKADLVIVCVPILMNKIICFEVFKYPWMSLIEKPVGYNYSEAKEILLEQKKQEANSFVALNRRHYNSTTVAYNDFENIDGVRIVQIQDQEDLLLAQKANHPKLVLKNWMYANSIHLIDYLSVFCRGEVISVDNTIPWSNKLFYVLSKIQYSSGDIGIYQCIWNGPGPWSVSISSLERRYEIRPLEKGFFQEKNSRIINEIDVSEWDKNYKPGLRMQAYQAIKAVRKKQHNLPSLEEGLKTMKLIKNIYEI
ncbi:MAG: oxidoreductase [Flavobacteriaceae bacterium]|nr:oxidoreductase [Flavobacteriaceae bacterium]|tara:strand:+ start:399 stop:1382 length:984 start_codon:yes stop_codon:yes gene_type:complete